MSNRTREDFATLIERLFSRNALDHEHGSVFGLAADGTLAYLNAAWDRFAEENGGQPAVDEAWNLGTPYLQAIAEPLRGFYRDLLASAPTREEALHPAQHRYECSSAATYREFVMHVYALGVEEGHLIVNTLVVERPHDSLARPAHEPDLSVYAERHGGCSIIRQCAHCRRVRHATDAARWDWVPAWVEQPPNGTSHGLCPVCAGYYYPLT